MANNDKVIIQFNKIVYELRHKHVHRIVNCIEQLTVN